MICPRCGHSTAVSTGLCPACGAAVAETAAVAGQSCFDTTGLSPGATGASTTLDHTLGQAIGDSVTVGIASPEGALTGGPLRVGQGFDPRYRIIKVLGVGGMGAVYQAWDAELSVAVALKVIRTDSRGRSVSPEAEKRFKQALLLARQVTHPNVVRIHDLGEIDGIKYITMPYIDGADLSTILKREGRLPVANVLRIARPVVSGLVAAHQAGVVHRDLKPANIMLDAEGKPVIMDFGIARSTGGVATMGVGPSVG